MPGLELMKGLNPENIRKIVFGVVTHVEHPSRGMELNKSGAELPVWVLETYLEK